jgi:tetratricopeptide (TPR) repeat protein
MKQLVFLFLVFSFTPFAYAGVTEDIHHLQTRWAEIKYQLPEKDKEKAFADLLNEAEDLTVRHKDNADLLIWEGIIRSTYAGAKGGLGALSEVKKAKREFEHAIEINPSAMNGSAYTSLGSLYYQVPAWPFGFGNDKKALQMLEKGLEINPRGIDSNFFYGDFLKSKKEFEAALAAFKKALQASPRPGRELADKGRKHEIEIAIQEVKQAMSKNRES